MAQWSYHCSIQRHRTSAETLSSNYFPELSYSDALFVAGLDRLSVRREQIVRDTFKNIKLPSHVLHNLLPAKLDHQFNSRDKYSYLLPVARTQRYANSFIIYCIRKRY